MMRRVYRCLLWLHPAAFRRQFEEEMLWIFDEAADACGAAALFSDASVSLVRQWLLRSGLWMWVVAGIAGIIPLIIAFGRLAIRRLPKAFARREGQISFWIVDHSPTIAGNPELAESELLNMEFARCKYATTG